MPRLHHLHPSIQRTCLPLLLLTSLAAPVASQAAPGWGYSRIASPEQWNTIAPVCGTGHQQSPVDIPRRLIASTPTHPLTFHYGPHRFEAENNGHAIELEPTRDNQYITLDGTRFTLKQFHMHTPTEHHVDGQPHQMELHLVHANGQGALAVVGIFFDVGAENAQLKELLAKAPAQLMRKDDEITLNHQIDLSKLIPQDSPIAQYIGSLTTPPCTEGVHWNVFLKPLTISRAQLDALRALYPENARPVQPLNGRWND